MKFNLVNMKYLGWTKISSQKFNYDLLGLGIGFW